MYLKKRAEEEPTYHPLLLTTLTTLKDETSSGPCEVSPLDETALVTAVEILSNVRLETSRLGPMITGPTKTEDRRGMKLQRSYHRDREFPRSPEGARTTEFDFDRLVQVRGIHRAIWCLNR